MIGPIRCIIAAMSTSPSESLKTVDGAPLSFGAAVRAGGLVASTAVASAVLQLAPTTYLLDSSELVATTYGLGISHPPGHPAYHMLGHVLTLLPVASIATRVHLFSAVASALALGLLPIAAHVAGFVRGRAGLWVASLLAVALWYTPGFALQSVRAEVYALNALIMAGASVVALLLIGRPPRPDDTSRSVAGVRETAALALVLGVGLLNHHFLVVFALPAMAFAVIAAGGGAALIARRVATGVVFGAAALAGYAYLPARAAAQPAASWGWPNTLHEIYWHVSAQAFQKSATLGVERDIVASAGRVFGVLADELGPVGLTVACVGLLLLWWRRRAIGAFLTLAVGLNLATQVLFDFDPMNPDARGYFMPSLWWLALGAAHALTAWSVPGEGAERTPALQGALGGIVALGIVLAGVTSPMAPGLRRSWDSELLRDEAFNGLPPRSAWITGYYETCFDTWYAQTVEDRRPDVVHLHNSFLTYPFYREMVEARGGAALLDASGALAVDGVHTWVRSHGAVQVEPELLVPPEIARASLPARLYLRVVSTDLPAGDFPAALDAEAAEQLDAVRARFGTPLETQTARNLLWASMNLATAMCDAGRVGLCAAAFERARGLAPNDPDLARMAAERLAAARAR